MASRSWSSRPDRFAPTCRRTRWRRREAARLQRRGDRQRHGAGRGARRIVQALRAEERELILAEGGEAEEAEAARLRRADPNLLFDLMARLVSDGYAKQLGASAETSS